jgi:hypothetical protein
MGMHIKYVGTITGAVCIIAVMFAVGNNSGLFFGGAFLSGIIAGSAALSIGEGSDDAKRSLNLALYTFAGIIGTFAVYAAVAYPTGSAADEFGLDILAAFGVLGVTGGLGSAISGAAIRPVIPSVTLPGIVPSVGPRNFLKSSSANTLGSSGEPSNGPKEEIYHENVPEFFQDMKPDAYEVFAERVQGDLPDSFLSSHAKRITCNYRPIFDENVRFWTRDTWDTSELKSVKMTEADLENDGYILQPEEFDRAEALSKYDSRKLLFVHDTGVIECGQCSGTGKYCTVCDGSGRRRCSNHCDSGVLRESCGCTNGKIRKPCQRGAHGVGEVCSACGGTEEVEEPCQACGGTGKKTIGVCPKCSEDTSVASGYTKCDNCRGGGIAGAAPACNICGGPGERLELDISVEKYEEVVYDDTHFPSADKTPDVDTWIATDSVEVRGMLDFEQYRDAGRFLDDKPDDADIEAIAEKARAQHNSNLTFEKLTGTSAGKLTHPDDIVQDREVLATDYESKFAHCFYLHYLLDGRVCAPDNPDILNEITCYVVNPPETESRDWPLTFRDGALRPVE